jgi:phosphopantothenoylcysteine decarboxylase/phosphopantothenate--cysteine ligase
VRFVGNRSSGKMGHALATEAYVRGADVVLITTQPARRDPFAVVPVETAADMAAAVRQHIDAAEVLVMAAAVADFKPREETAGKIERAGREALTLELVPAVDVLGETAGSSAFRVAFAAEAGPRLQRAREKRLAKGVDLLVFNDIAAAGVGFGADDNELTIIGPSREVHVPRTSKAACAAAVFDEIDAGLAER